MAGAALANFTPDDELSGARQPLLVVFVSLVFG